MEQFSPAMMVALAHLRALLKDGVEWPDAIWKVTTKSGLMAHEVEKAFDIVESED